MRKRFVSHQCVPTVAFPLSLAWICILFIFSLYSLCVDYIRVAQLATVMNIINFCKPSYYTTWWLTLRWICKDVFKQWLMLGKVWHGCGIFNGFYIRICWIDNSADLNAFRMLEHSVLIGCKDQGAVGCHGYRAACASPHPCVLSEAGRVHPLPFYFTPHCLSHTLWSEK